MSSLHLSCQNPSANDTKSQRTKRAATQNKAATQAAERGRRT